MRPAVLLPTILILLSACGRPLTPGERGLAEAIYDGQLDVERVRLADHAPVRAYTMRIPRRPRLTCQERIFPPPDTDVVTGAPAAMTLFNTIWLNHDYWAEDYQPYYPEALHLYPAMLLAHELAHVWQWQNRERTGYHPLKALREHRASADPYLFDPDTRASFRDFGYEQQASIIEEYVCCEALDPEAPRTARLRAMISEAFPVGRLPHRATILPWAGAKVEGICR